MASSTTKPVTLRLKNEQIEAIDHIVELGDFANRNEAIRAMLWPALVQFVVAMETKSVTKAAAARIKAELTLQARISLVAKNSEIQDKLELDIPGIQAHAI